jgi:hypothetical protein
MHNTCTCPCHLKGNSTVCFEPKTTQACQTALQFESRSSIQFCKFMGIVLIQQMDLFELTAAKTPEYDKSVIVSPYVGENTQQKNNRQIKSNLQALVLKFQRLKSCFSILKCQFVATQLNFQCFLAKMVEVSKEGASKVDVPFLE